MVGFISSHCLASSRDQNKPTSHLYPTFPLSTHHQPTTPSPTPKTTSSLRRTDAITNPKSYINQNKAHSKIRKYITRFRIRVHVDADALHTPIMRAKAN